jgi:hypothetical protein
MLNDEKKHISYPFPHHDHTVYFGIKSNVTGNQQGQTQPGL